MGQDIQSDAFRDATLRSERYRIVGLLIACAFFISVNFTNALVHRDVEHWHRSARYISWWLIVAAYEGVMLWIATRADRAGRQVRPWVWVVNTVVECTLPTFALMGISVDKTFLG